MHCLHALSIPYLHIPALPSMSPIDSITKKPSAHQVTFPLAHSFEIETVQPISMRPFHPAFLSSTYPSHLEIPKNTPPLPTHHTSIPKLRRPCIAMHLRKLQLRLRSCPLWQRGIVNDVAKGLTFGFVLGEDFAFRVVADNLVVYEAAQIESFRAEGGHCDVVGDGVECE